LRQGPVTFILEVLKHPNPGKKMAEIKGDSAEAVAFELLVTIAKAQGVHLDKERAGWSKEQILATYRECLSAVRGGSAATATALRPVG
jgi:hypothetical protein